MKTVEFADRWMHRTSETVVEEYPAGSKLGVSEDRAKAAHDAGVLTGEPAEPVPAPNAKKPAKA